MRYRDGGETYGNTWMVMDTLCSHGTGNPYVWSGDGCLESPSINGC